MVAGILTDGGAHSGICVKETNDFGFGFFAGLEELRNFFPPSFPFGFRSVGVRGMRNNGIKDEEGSGDADDNPTAIFLGVSNDTKLIHFESVALPFFKAVRVIAIDPKFKFVCQAHMLAQQCG